MVVVVVVVAAVAVADAPYKIAVFLAVVATNAVAIVSYNTVCISIQFLFHGIRCCNKINNI